MVKSFTLWLDYCHEQVSESLVFLSRIITSLSSVNQPWKPVTLLSPELWRVHISVTCTSCLPASCRPRKHVSSWLCFCHKNVQSPHMALLCCQVWLHDFCTSCRCQCDWEKKSDENIFWGYHLSVPVSTLLLPSHLLIFTKENVFRPNCNLFVLKKMFSHFDL